MCRVMIAQLGPPSAVAQRTLDAHHSRKVAQFRAALEDLPRKLEELRELEAGAKTDGGNEERLAQLRREIWRTRRCNEELQYYTRTADVIFRYYDIVENCNAASPYPPKTTQPQTNGNGNGPPRRSVLDFFKVSPEIPAAQTNANKPPTHRDDRATLLRRYMHLTDFQAGCFQADLAAAAALEAGTTTNTAPPKCRHCGSTQRCPVISDGLVYCNDCATVEYIVVDHDKPSFKEPPKEVSYFAYKRINHFNEWIAQVQGKETTDIPDEVYDKILLEFKKERVTNMAEVTPSKLKDVLRRLKLNKFYEHIPHILHKLNGAAMPHMPPELEEQLRSMFKQVQVPFLKHAPCYRKNFASYAFIIHKFLQLLGRDEFLKYFPLLKSREKLQMQDNMFKKICADLNWHFIKSL
jgi:hypothetical protein